MSSGIRKVKSVSFSRKELNLLEFADTKGNFSDYVKALIKKDISSRETLTPEIRDEIRRYIDGIYKATSLKVEDEVQVKDPMLTGSLDAIFNMD